jgi:hypothetical protein
VHEPPGQPEPAGEGRLVHAQRLSHRLH